LEQVLDDVEMQLRSDEVNMVINCLQNAKRFQITVSFIVDMGLKDATAYFMIIQSCTKSQSQS
jgi:hypothetical protein